MFSVFSKPFSYLYLGKSSLFSNKLEVSSKESISSLREKVTSKGGTQFRAMNPSSGKGLKIRSIKNKN